MTVPWNNGTCCERNTNCNLHLTDSYNPIVTIKIIRSDCISDDSNCANFFLPEFSNLHSKTVVEVQAFSEQVSNRNGENFLHKWIQDICFRIPAVLYSRVHIRQISNNEFAIYFVIVVHNSCKTICLLKSAILPSISTCGKHRKSMKKASNYGTAYSDSTNQHFQANNMQILTL